MKPINVGLLGIGTVGGGTWDVLNRNADEIQRRAGRAIDITQVADKAVEVARKKVGKKARVLSDAFEVVRAKDVDIVIELIGGYTVAKDLVLEAIRPGKHVDTALKDAQKRGYAETDPTFDIEGVDAAHKLTILSALAFGIPMQFKKAYTEGISGLTQTDIR